MYNKKIILALVFILMLVSPVVVASSIFSLPHVSETVEVTTDARCLVTQDVTYDLNGEINGTYRTIPLSGKQVVDDISVETPGYYNTVEVINQSDSTQIKVHLFADEAKTQKVRDTKVNVVYHYTVKNAVKVYNDIAELQYMSWGSTWDSSVDSLETRIVIPGSKDNVQEWNNPPGVVKSSQWVDDHTLVTEYDSLAEGRSVEQRIIMPREYITSTEFADVINKDAKDQIIRDQEAYLFWQGINDNAGYISAIVSALLLFVPALIYWRFGRSPKTDYFAEYESSLPTNHSPVFVNSLVYKDAGKTTVEGFNATLLDLIDRGYIKTIASTSEDTIIKPTSKDKEDLKQYERDILDYIGSFADRDSCISFSDMSSNSSKFNQFMNAWQIDVNREVSPLDVRSFFDNRGDTYLTYSIFALVVYAVLSILVLRYFFADGKSSLVGMVMAGVLIIEQIILFVSPLNTMGHWTSDGKVFHDKWKNFERYIKDYSLIKERPPASVQVWGRYLVYATALGCADEVNRNMKKYFREANIGSDALSQSSAVFFSNLYGLDHMDTAFVGPFHVGSDANFGDMGSYGDIGGPGSGGFGGGGGGVF